MMANSKRTLIVILHQKKMEWGKIKESFFFAIAHNKIWRNYQTTQFETPFVPSGTNVLIMFNNVKATNLTFRSQNCYSQRKALVVLFKLMDF